MSIVKGFRKFKNFIKNQDGTYILRSLWTSAQTVECSDGLTVEEKIGSFKGVTANLSTTEDGYAADIKTVSLIQDDLQTRLQPWHDDEILIGTYGNENLFEKCIYLNAGSGNSTTKTINHNIPIKRIISLHKTCIYSNSHHFSDILLWDVGAVTSFLYCDFSRTAVKFMYYDSWSGNFEGYFKVQYTKL